jgi:hypothetical protein
MIHALTNEETETIGRADEDRRRTENVQIRSCRAQVTSAFLLQRLREPARRFTSSPRLENVGVVGSELAFERILTGEGRL